MQQYTLHTIGIVSSIAANLALGAYDLVGFGVGALRSFLTGAASFAIGKCGHVAPVNSGLRNVCSTHIQWWHAAERGEFKDFECEPADVIVAAGDFPCWDLFSAVFMSQLPSPDELVHPVPRAFCAPSTGCSVRTIS